MKQTITTICHGEYAIEIHPRRWESARQFDAKTRVYVADAVAETRDETLRELLRAEAQLGERRYAKRGEHTDVDKLYDALNRQISRVKREIAVEAANVAFIDKRYSQITGRFSRHAGCTCRCSPGVVLDRTVRISTGSPVDIWVSAPKIEA